MRALGKLLIKTKYSRYCIKKINFVLPFRISLKKLSKSEIYYFFRFNRDQRADAELGPNPVCSMEVLPVLQPPMPATTTSTPAPQPTSSPRCPRSSTTDKHHPDTKFFYHLSPTRMIGSKKHFSSKKDKI